jgi:hypothetical protein
MILNVFLNLESQSKALSSCSLNFLRNHSSKPLNYSMILQGVLKKFNGDALTVQNRFAQSFNKKLSILSQHIKKVE